MVAVESSIRAAIERRAGTRLDIECMVLDFRDMGIRILWIKDAKKKRVKHSFYFPDEREPPLNEDCEQSKGTIRGGKRDKPQVSINRRVSAGLDVRTI